MEAQGPLDIINTNIFENSATITVVDACLHCFIDVAKRKFHMIVHLLCNQFVNNFLYCIIYYQFNSIMCKSTARPIMLTVFLHGL